MPPSKFFILQKPWALKHLEVPSLYNPASDELYELNQSAFKFLESCISRTGQTAAARKNQFINFCLNENILAVSEKPAARKFIIKKSPVPSLRYLLVHITDVCNLRCRHCYVGEPRNKYLKFRNVKKILDEFEKIQGLRLLISGGEPLLHPDFWRINKLLPGYNFRKILLTNGLLFSPGNIAQLNFDDIQVSLDGLAAGHEALRGAGTFNKTVAAIKMLKKGGRGVSVSTMAHARNLQELPGLKKMVTDLEVNSWTIDIPYQIGRLSQHREFLVSPAQAARYLKYSFGPEGHNVYGKWACGTHLMAVMADGQTDKCGYFLNKTSPQISSGLRACFLKNKRIPLNKLACRDCRFILECRGGCRARAAGRFDRDPYMCYHNFGGENDENKKIVQKGPVHL